MHCNPTCRPPARKRRALLLATLLACGAPLSSLAQQSRLADDSGPPPSRDGLLDGTWFGGDWGHEDKPAYTHDLVEFTGGQFSSKCCARLGFVPAPYEAERIGDAIRFSAVTHSPTHGTMVWRGTVRDGQVEATVQWRREQFLWTHENEFWFKGQYANKVACR